VSDRTDYHAGRVEDRGRGGADVDTSSVAGLLDHLESTVGLTLEHGRHEVGGLEPLRDRLARIRPSDHVLGLPPVEALRRGVPGAHDAVAVDPIVASGELVTAAFISSFASCSFANVRASSSAVIAWFANIRSTRRFSGDGSGPRPGGRG
jgi:hypothetical protein